MRIRVNKKNGCTKGFTSIENAALQDESLSWAARGLLACMLSMPQGWDFVYTDLEKRSPAKRCAFKTAFNELVKAGYVWREKSPVRGRRDCISVSEIPYTGDEWQVLRFLLEKNPSENKELYVPELRDGLYPTEHGRLRGK